MAERLMGVETEYAISGRHSWGGTYDQSALLNTLMGLARKRLTHLPDVYSGIYLGNGSRLYVDYGNHPELSTPECANPWDVVRYILAGERMLAGLAEEAKRELSGPEVMLFKSNVDYGSWVTWGCHESYLHRASPQSLSAEIIPHLVSRIIYTGAGGFNSLSSGLAFILSPRVPHLANVMSNNSTSDRGIFHTKDESLSKPGYHRLHIICGESLCSETSMWLKVATTALVVAMAEADLHPGRDVTLRAPLQAMQAIANDQSCSSTVEMTSGARLSALEIQYHYLNLAEKNLHCAQMPPWAEEACRQWRAVLNNLLDAPDSVATTLDWAIKRALYEDYTGKRGIEWSSLPHWTRVLADLKQAHDYSTEYERPLTADFILHRRSPLRNEVERLTPYIKSHGLRWESLEAVLALRKELFEIDTRFGQLSGAGIFAGLDNAGVLSHHVEGVESIEDAMTYPPAVGRAHLRGEVIRRLASEDGPFQCDWQGVVDIQRKRVLDLSEPFEMVERWFEAANMSVNWQPAFFDILATLNAREAATRDAGAQDPGQPDGWPGTL